MNQTQRVLGVSSWIVLLCLCPSVLGGCAVAVVAGGAGTALMVNDRRTSGAYVEDQAIETKAENRLRTQFSDRIHVNITSYNRQVLLTGQVPDQATRDQVAQTLSAIDNVRRVFNESIIGPVSALAERSGDAMLTSDVKARMVATKGFSANHIKVTTEAGVCYLMGLVTPEEADIAARIVAQVRGVTRVVTVFEYLPESATTGH